MYCRAHLSSYLDALESEIAIPLTGLLTCPIRPQESGNASCPLVLRQHLNVTTFLIVSGATDPGVQPFSFSDKALGDVIVTPYLMSRSSCASHTLALVLYISPLNGSFPLPTLARK